MQEPRISFNWLTTCLNNRLYSIFLICRRPISTNCVKDAIQQQNIKIKLKLKQKYRVCKQLKQKWRATNVFSSASQTESDARHVPCCENTKNETKSGKTRTLAIKKKITNKQTSENIYKLIPGRSERERERDTMYYNKNWIYFILHAVDLAASSIVVSASVFPPSSNNNNNNIRE